MILYEGDPEAASEAAVAEATRIRGHGRKAEIIDFKGDTEEAARFFFARLRALDRKDTDLIICVGVPEKGLGEAVMDRMRKAAGGRVVKIVPER